MKLYYFPTNSTNVRHPYEKRKEKEEEDGAERNSNSGGGSGKEIQVVERPIKSIVEIYVYYKCDSMLCSCAFF